jgi:predicted ester cyclase
MTTEQNKAIVRRFFEALEANDQSTLREMLAPNLVAYTHGQTTPLSRDSMLEAISNWNSAFEIHFTIEEQIAEGDKVATRQTFRAIHNRGAFQGIPPSGKQAEMEGINIETIRDGKIVERRVITDWSGMMQQLGLVPQTVAAR